MVRASLTNKLSSGMQSECGYSEASIRFIVYILDFRNKCRTKQQFYKMRRVAQRLFGNFESLDGVMRLLCAYTQP